MSYTTITDLPEKLIDELQGDEVLLLTEPNSSYKVTLDTITSVLINLSAGTYQSLTSKLIDDVSNFVHANAIHFAAQAVRDIPKGAPVKVISSVTNQNALVDIALTGDEVIGICEDGLSQGELGEIMHVGVLTEMDTSAFSEGALLYSAGGELTMNQPADGNKRHFVGYVLNTHEEEGRILITSDDPLKDADEVVYVNVGSNITSTNVQDAITEVNSRVTDLEEILFQQASAPTVAQGASDGDIWLDTVTNTLKVYREYPLGTGIYRWEPLIYKWDDTVDGGSW